MTIDASVARADSTVEEDLERERTEFTRYRNRVRERAIKGWRDSEWPLDALNDALSRLGLDTYQPAWVAETALSLEVRLRTNDDDAGVARQKLSPLEHQDFRNAALQALSTVIAEHLGTEVTVPPQSVLLHLPYPTVRVGDDRE